MAVGRGGLLTLLFFCCPLVAVSRPIHQTVSPSVITGSRANIPGNASTAHSWNESHNSDIAYRPIGSNPIQQGIPPVHSPCRLLSVRSGRLRRLCHRLLAGQVAPTLGSDWRLLLSKNQSRILSRRRRSGYDYADYSDWEEDADLLDYENKESDLSLLEKMNKKGRTVVLAAVVGLNVFMCCFCSFCLFICKAISNDHEARRENFITFYDHICCRDHAYRPVVKFFKSLDLRPPTYNEFKRMRAGYKSAFGGE